MLKGEVEIRLINSKTNKIEYKTKSNNFVNPNYLKFAALSNMVDKSASSTPGNGINTAGGSSSYKFGIIEPIGFKPTYFVLSDNSASIPEYTWFFPGNIVGWVSGVYANGGTTRGTIVDSYPDTKKFGNKIVTTFRFTETQGGTGGNMTFQTIGFSPVNLSLNSQSLINIGYSLFDGSAVCRGNNVNKYYVADGNTIYLYDILNNTRTNVYTNSTNIRSMDCDGNYIYIIYTNGSSIAVRKISILDYTVSATNTTAGFASDGHVVKIGNYVYVINEYGDTSKNLIKLNATNLFYLDTKTLPISTYESLKYIGNNYDGFAVDGYGQKFDIDTFMNGDGSVNITYLSKRVSLTTQIHKTWEDNYISKTGIVYYGGTSLTTCCVLNESITKTSSQILDIVYTFSVEYPLVI